MAIINMQDILNITPPTTITFATAFTKKAPSVVFIHAVLAANYTDAGGAINLPAGTWLNAKASSITKTGCSVSVTTPDGKPMVNPVVNLTCSAFE